MVGWGPAEAADRYGLARRVSARVTIDAKTLRGVWGGHGEGFSSVHPELLKTLDAVGLSWLTHLCSVTWRCGTVIAEWQTGVVVPIFTKGNQRMCSNYRGITLLSFSGKVYARVMERRHQLTVKPLIQE